MKKRINKKLNLKKHYKLFVVNQRKEFEKKHAIDFQNSSERLSIYAKTGLTKKSLTRLRNHFGITDLTIETDFMTNDEDHVSVYNSSWWISGLTDEEFTELQSMILKELNELHLPATLSEQYLTALVWGGKISPYFTPKMLLPTVLVGAEKLVSVPLSTEQKRFLTNDFRKEHNLPQKGVIPTSLKVEWDKLNKILKAAKTDNRKLRATNLYKIATTPKKTLQRDKVRGKRNKPAKETDSELYERLTPIGLVDLMDDKNRQKALTKRNAQNIRKTRERIKKLKKI